MQDLASEFAKIFRGWYTGTSQREGAFRTQDPNLGPPQLFSRGCAPGFLAESTAALLSAECTCRWPLSLSKFGQWVRQLTTWFIVGGWPRGRPFVRRWTSPFVQISTNSDLNSDGLTASSQSPSAGGASLYI